MTDADNHDIMAVSVGPENPATDVDVEVLREGLASDDENVRLHAANVASFVPLADVETLIAVLPELRDCLAADDLDVTNYQAAIAVKVISEEDPTLLEEAVPRLVELLNHEMSLIRSVTATCMANVAMERPEFIASEVAPLVAVTVTEPEDTIDREHMENRELGSEQRKSLEALNWEEGVRDQLARDVAANLLVEVADHDHSLVEPHLDDLVAILDTAPFSVRTAVADVVAQVAKNDPAAASNAVEPLCAQLDQPQDALVATSITALGFIEDSAAVDPLRELAADEERAEDLRELAAETADFIDGRA